MVGLYSFLYACIFAFLSNCFILISGSGLKIAFCITAFIIFNAVSGLFFLKTKSKRLKFLFHGTVQLLSFCVSVTVSVIVELLLFTKVLPCADGMLFKNAVYCFAANFILFWNGIISVYLTSVQLGIKTRIVGLLCGMIPIAHLIALGSIISKTYRESVFESGKEKLNRERAENSICKTKYPILFVHGVFFRDYKHLNYWGRIPGELTENGAVCYYGNHQSALSVKDSGEELARRIREITEQTGCGKVNIIAHSKGGLDCRYALDKCGVSEHVASLTTINTPHRGCEFADWLLGKASPQFKENVASVYNASATVLGDKTPDFLAAVKDLTAEFCKNFDQSTPLPENVFCQSVGSVMKKASSGKFPLNLSNMFVKMFSGQNDGLVGVDSFEWGEKYTLLDMTSKRGISHGDMIDLNRENIPGFDVREFYVSLVSELRERGL